MLVSVRSHRPDQIKKTFNGFKFNKLNLIYILKTSENYI